MGPALASAGGVRGVPTNSQQAQFVSTIDSIHPDFAGTRYIGSKAWDKMADTPIPIERVLQAA